MIFYDDLTGNKYEVDRIQLELDVLRCRYYFNDTAKLVREKSGESIIVTWNDILSMMSGFNANDVGDKNG